MTVIQAQCLLLYLGYSPGLPDNVAGVKTSGAASAFQADYGLPVTGKLDDTTCKMLIAAVSGTAVKVDKPQTGSWWDNIKYFKPDEPNIRCPCPRCVGKHEDPTEALMKTADSIREELGPMVPSSVRRCQEHNDELPGSAKNSRHIIGKAMDFNATKSTPAQIESCLARKKAAGEIRYWYRMSSGWYHFDID
jgi:peptidoglycan hydrolase-like protein with peptidoglycan-binding domain